MKKGLTIFAQVLSQINMKNAIMYHNGSDMTAGTIGYLPITPSYSASFNWQNFDASDPANAQQSFATVFPCAGLIKNLYIWFDSDNPMGETTVITFFKNGVATTITVSLSDAGLGVSTLENDLIHSVIVSAGDLMTMEANLSAGATGGTFSISYEFDPS